MTPERILRASADLPSPVFADETISPLTPLSAIASRHVNHIELPSIEKSHGEDVASGDDLDGFNPSRHLCAAAQMYATGGEAWRILAELHGHSSAVTCLALDRKGRLISGSRDKTLRVWDLHEIQKEFKPRGSTPSFRVKRLLQRRCM